MADSSCVVCLCDVSGRCKHRLFYSSPSRDVLQQLQLLTAGFNNFIPAHPSLESCSTSAQCAGPFLCYLCFRKLEKIAKMKKEIDMLEKELLSAIQRTAMISGTAVGPWHRLTEPHGASISLVAVMFN